MMEINNLKTIFDILVIRDTDSPLATSGLLYYFTKARDLKFECLSIMCGKIL
jgi:hypothetical protein